MADETKVGTRPSWKIRRRVIAASLAYCAGMVGYLAIFAETTTLREQVATGLILLAGSIIGSYVFGAVWDDRGRQ